MPFKSKAQQRFMFSQHPEMAKEWADKTPDISKLPEHVKKMADGGMVDKDEPGLQDATVGDSATLAALAGLAGAAPEIMEAAPEMLGSEAGEFTLGKAPEMEGLAAEKPDVEVVKLGIQKGGKEPIQLYTVKGKPEEVSKLGFGSDPASIPEHILRQHGLLPDESIAIPDQNAPNSFADGGEVKEKVNSMSDIGTLKGLRDLLMKNSQKDDFEAKGSTDPVGGMGYADGGEVLDPTSIMQQAAAMSAQPTDVENGMTPSNPIGAQDLPSGILPDAPGNPQGMGPSYNDLQTPNPISQATQTAQTLPPTNPGIYQGITADRRAALMQQLLAQKNGAGGLAAKGVAGLGDAISNAFGKGGQNAMGNIENMQNQNIANRVGVVDTQRQQRMQDLQANLAQQENDPSSQYSQGMRQFYSQLTGKTFPSGISASMMKSAFPDYAKIFDSQLTAATATRGQVLGAQEKLAAKSPWQRLVDNIMGNPAEETLAKETGVTSQTPDNGGWSVVK